MYSYKENSPVYSSCSSENLGSWTKDRRCMRCLIHELENVTEGDGVPTKGTFTRSFSVESGESFAELFKKSEEDFSGEGTRVLFCKALDVTSDEDEDKRGLKRTYEDRMERKKGGRYKRICSSDDFGERYRPSSKCSVRSEVRRPPKPLTELTAIKKRSRPSLNRSHPSSCSQRIVEMESKSKLKPSKVVPAHRDINKIPLRKNKHRIEENDEVTIYEKTIITVTSSDNYLMGDPMSPLLKYKSDLSQKLARAMSSKMKPEGHVPASIGVYGANKSALRKGLMKRDVKMNRSNDVQILPVIQELNMQDEGINHPKPRSSVSSDSECIDKPKRHQMSIAVKGARGTVENKAQVQGVHSTLFPNSCLKKVSEKSSSSKKSVRFMVSDSQSNLGGEKIPKKSLRLEKFPSKSSVKPPYGNDGMGTLTAAPVVVRIENTKLERMDSLGGDGINNIIHTETAQRIIQEQLIKNLDFIQNINTSRGQGMNLLRSPSNNTTQATQFEFSFEDLNQSIVGPHVRSFSMKRLGVEKSSTEVHYTLSDLGIPRKRIDIEADIEKANADPVPIEMRMVQDTKKSSLDERRKNIRLKLIESHPKNKVADARDDNETNTENSNPVKSSSGRASRLKSSINNKERSGVNSGNRNTKGNEVGKARVGRDKPESNKSMIKSVTRKEVMAARRSTEIQKNGGAKNYDGLMKIKSQSRPTTAASKTIVRDNASFTSVRNATNGALRPKSQETGGISEQVEGDVNAYGSHSRTQSPNRPPSRKPHLSMIGRVNDDSNIPPGKIHRAPRNSLTVRPKTQPDLKKTSAIRQHLRSSEGKSSALTNPDIDSKRGETRPNKSLTRKLSGHPLKNKTLSEFLKERKMGPNNNKKKNANDARRTSEPVKRNG